MASKKDKYATAEFRPKNPQKYVGKYPIIYRSSWEHTVMRLFDTHPNVIAWASESIQIPYINPVKKMTNGHGSSVYIPDFFVVYEDKNGKKHAELIEVKPLSQVPGYREEGKNGKQKRLTKGQQTQQVINYAKWEAAIKFCAKRNLHFRVASEDELFAWQKKKKSTK